jgi:peptidoglycan L-alanyl-D-glutamate endopeptidase CwlK
MAKIDTLNPDFKEKVEMILEILEMSTGYKWRVTEARRTITYQNELYAKGRTTPGSIVTNAKGGSSAHNFGDAADIVPVKDGVFWWEAPKKLWDALGELAEGMGLTWGGHFKSITDYPHIEDPEWKQHYADWKAGKITIG